MHARDEQRGEPRVVGVHRTWKSSIAAWAGGLLTAWALLHPSSTPFGTLSAATPTLAERLGYPPDARLLIINGDDVGMCHTANLATIEGLERGLLTSAMTLLLLRERTNQLVH